jgi:acid stress-induced BolA-like protein IbaG/YrbA
MCDFVHPFVILLSAEIPGNQLLKRKKLIYNFNTNNKIRINKNK